jgi:hypothetical protein
VDEEIDLEKGAALFEAAPAARFPIMGQVIQPGRNFYPAVTDIEVRAVFNTDDIAVLIQWNDMSSETEGSNSPLLPTAPFDPAEEERLQRRTTAGQEATDDFWGDPFAEEVQPVDSGEAGGEAATVESPYSDAVALQVPLALPTGIRKPYFVFGDSGNPVDLWFLDLASEQPRTFVASGSNTLEEGVEDSLTAVKEYQDGRWSVIFGRKRTSSRSISFEEGSFVPIAFSVWDGFNHERGNKRALTGWYYLYLEPVNRPSALGPMVSNSLTVFIGMIVIVFLARRKLASTARQEDRE